MKLIAKLKKKLFKFILTFIVVTMLVLKFFSNRLGGYVKLFSLSATLVVYFWALLLWVNFDELTSFYQYIDSFPTIFWNNKIVFGVDGVALIFLLLTALIMPICVLAGWDINNRPRDFNLNLLAIELLLIIVFSTTDIIIFFLSFEAILIPMFFLILMWGGRERRIKASYYFFIYTFFGSLFLLLAVLLVIFESNSTSFLVIQYHNFSVKKQLVLWVLFFVPFIIKIPMVPFHIWLPEAHVEAPTVGSVILASLLLKLGGYGLIRYNLTLLPFACVYFKPVVYLFASISVLFASINAFVQLDIKRIIAYSSIAHMNVVVLGIFSLNLIGVCGAIVMMFSHGVVSAALFLLIGVLYNRHHSRSVEYYGGLASVMPLFITCFFLFIISNFSFPMTSNFISELLILLGVMQTNFFLAIFVGLSSWITLAYSIYFFNRIAFGNLKVIYITQYIDLMRYEASFLLPLVAINFLIGLYPNVVFQIILPAVKFIFLKNNF